MRGPLKTWLGRVGLIVGGVLVGLVVAEGAARMMEPAGHSDLLFNSSDAHPQGMYLTDPELVMVPAPGFSQDVGAVGYQVPVRFDAQGLRGTGVGPKAEGQKRLLALGDSFTMAVQVREEDTFVAHLAERTGWSVVNAGVDGYTTQQSMVRYRRLDGPLDVDGVLLTFFLGNDLHEQFMLDGRLRAGAEIPAGSPVSRSQVSAAQRFFMRSSFLYARYLVWQRQKWLQTGQDPLRERWKDELSIFTNQGHARLTQLVDQMRPPVQALRDEVRRRGDNLMVAVAAPAFVVHPERVASTFEVMGLDPASAELDGPGQAVMLMMRRAGIRVCDLTPSLRAAAEDGTAMHFAYDGHWTPAGHAVVARTIAGCYGYRPDAP